MNYKIGSHGPGYVSHFSGINYHSWSHDSQTYVSCLDFVQSLRSYRQLMTGSLQQNNISNNLFKISLSSLNLLFLQSSTGNLISQAGIHNHFWLFPLLVTVVLQSLSPVWLFCDPMDCSTPGLPILHYFLEFAQIHVHWVCDAMQLSHPLSPASPALSLSQHQSLFQWVDSASGEGNGTPLQYSCLENPMDGGAW